MTGLRILHVATEVSPLVSGNLAESTAALARALAEHGALPTVLTICAPEADPTRIGFARRLQKLSLGEETVEVFEGSVTKGVSAWIARAPVGMAPREALAATVGAALSQLDIEFAVALAHGSAAVGALDEVNRLRPQAICVATVGEPISADIDAVVLPSAGADGAVQIPPGIDDQTWNPGADPSLPAHFDSADPRGKARCKSLLQHELGRVPRADVPLIVARTERGRQQLSQALSDRLAYSAQLVAEDTPGVSSRKLLGGADFVVLTDEEGAEFDVLRALRYGTIPLVATGSTASEAVVEFHARTRSGLGIHYDRDPESLAAALRRACHTYADTDGMSDLRVRALSTDVSWRHPSRQYLHLFERLARD